MGLSEAKRQAKAAYMRAYYRRNHSARTSYNRRYYQKSRVERSTYERARNFGLTVKQLNEMKAQQNGRCACCEAVVKPTARSLDGFAIDHDHRCCSNGTSCGKCVRALLCASCNWGLGNFGDDVNRLRKAIAYLEKWQ